IRLFDYRALLSVFDSDDPPPLSRTTEPGRRRWAARQQRRGPAATAGTAGGAGSLGPEGAEPGEADCMAVARRGRGAGAPVTQPGAVRPAERARIRRGADRPAGPSSQP